MQTTPVRPAEAPTGDEAQGAQRITMTFTMTFDHVFDALKPLSKQDFVDLAREHIEYMKKEFPTGLQKYPTDLMKELEQRGLLELGTFR